MNEPNIPDDSRGWDSIDIFLFSNGQQYSPPRKYHLQSDDMVCWDATKTYLARSQFGEMHSAIELYSLNGKKIEGPLELKNAAAYVAVEPPETFIPAGYEKYLIKASRSWEKRQEKLTNSNEITKTDKKGMYLDITTVKQIAGIVSIKTTKDNSTTDLTKFIIEPQINVERPKSTRLNSAKEKLFPKKKSNNFERGAILNKNKICSKIINNDRSLLKTKNIPLKSLNRNNKQAVTTSKNTKTPTIPTRENKTEWKNKSKTDIVEISEILKNDTSPEILRNTNHINEDFEKISDKELTTVSNVYINIESDEQSTFVEVDRKTTIDDSMKMTRELSQHNILMANGNLIPDVLRADRTTSYHVIEEQLQSYRIPLQDRKENINIKLRIKLEDHGNHLKNDRSIITLIKKEKASQVNIDLILNKDIFTFNNNFILNGKSVEPDVIKNYEEHIHKNGNDRLIFLNCTCNKLNQKTDVLNESNGLNESKGLNESNLKNVLLLPTKINESIRSKDDPKENEILDKEVQKSSFGHSNTILSPTKAGNDKSENTTKREILLLEKDPKEIQPKMRSKFENDVKMVSNKIPINSFKIFDEKFTQTEWCNVVLQAKSHEDGHYTFHLPTLSLLKQYNINQV